MLIEQSLKFDLKANDNQVKYEALIAGMTLALEVGTSNLKSNSDSQLVVNQVAEEYMTEEPQIIMYLKKGI